MYWQEKKKNGKSSRVKHLCVRERILVTILGVESMIYNVSQETLL